MRFQQAAVFAGNNFPILTRSSWRHILIALTKNTLGGIFIMHLRRGYGDYRLFILSKNPSKLGPIVLLDVKVNNEFS